MAGQDKNLVLFPFLTTVILQAKECSLVISFYQKEDLRMVLNRKLKK